MRRFIVWLHRYVGLAAVVVLVMSGLTGAVITFDGEIDRATHPELRRVEPRPLTDTVTCALPFAAFDVTPSITGTGGPDTADRSRSKGAAHNVPACTYNRWPLGTYRP